MSQVTDLALTIQQFLYNNWSLEDLLENNKITWFSYEPTRIEIREKPLVISVTYQSGTGDPTCKAISQMKDQIKIDIYLWLRNLEGDTTRIQGEANRVTLKNEILKLIHDNQTAISGVKFGKYVRSARSDEVEGEQWYLHEIIYIQTEWYHTSS